MSVNALTYCTNCWYPDSFSMHRNLIVSLRLLLYASLTGLRLSHFTVTGSTRTQLRFSTRFRIKFVRRTCRTAARFLLRVWGFCARDSHRFFCGYYITVMVIMHAYICCDVTPLATPPESCALDRRPVIHHTVFIPHTLT